MEMIKKTELSEEKLSELRNLVSERMDSNRFTHTLGVEREVCSLSELFLPDEMNRLRAAALLHDVTKQEKGEKQLKMCEEFGIMIDDSLKAAPKLLHAITGAGVAKRDFSEFTDDEIISAIRWHTTGRWGMTLFESIVYLADYIEDTRTFEDCVVLRRVFYNQIEKARSTEEKFWVLNRTLVSSFDMTMTQLIKEGALIDRDTVQARNFFLMN